MGGVMMIALIISVFPFFARAPESRKISLPPASSLPKQEKINETRIKEWQVPSVVPMEVQWQHKMVLQWGGAPPAVGGKPYDPGAGNGISGGAMPLDLWATPQDDLFITDGYGPRLLQFNAEGKLHNMVDFKMLRPEHFSQVAALSGFRVARDVLGRWLVLDQEKKMIYGFNAQGQWVKTWDIKDLLGDHYLIHDVHPILEVAGKDFFYLRLTVSDPNDEIQKALKGIPVRNARVIGIWLDGCHGDFEEIQPNKTFFIYGYDAWHMDRLDHDQWVIQHERLDDGRWQPYQRWIFKDFPHQGGDIIGLDHSGNLYWWSSAHKIACLNIISHQLLEMLVPAEYIYQPAAVHPQGGVILLGANKDQVNIFHMHWVQD